MRTRAGAGTSRNPATTAINSIRLFVVARSPPEVSHCSAMLPSSRRATRTAAYPPGPPGLPAQAPSVQRSNVRSLGEATMPAVCLTMPSARSHSGNGCPSGAQPLDLLSEAQATGAPDELSIRAACQRRMTTRALRGSARAAYATRERSPRGDGRGNGGSRRAFGMRIRPALGSANDGHCAVLPRMSGQARDKERIELVAAAAVADVLGAKLVRRDVPEAQQMRDFDLVFSASRADEPLEVTTFASQPEIETWQRLDRIDEEVVAPELSHDWYLDVGGPIIGQRTRTLDVRQLAKEVVASLVALEAGGYRSIEHGTMDRDSAVAADMRRLRTLGVNGGQGGGTPRGRMRGSFSLLRLEGLSTPISSLAESNGRRASPTTRRSSASRPRRYAVIS